MMRKIFVSLLLLVSGYAMAQPSNYVPYASRNRYIALMADSTFHIPRFNGAPSLRTGGSTNDGALAADTANNRLYIYNGGSWTVVNKDTSNTFLNSLYKKSGSDSVFQIKGGTHTFAFTVGGSGSDTTSLSNRINLKVSIADTAAMLSGYTRLTRFTDSLAAHTSRFEGMNLQSVTNSGREVDSIFIDNGATGEKYALRSRNLALSFPIPTIKPTSANKNIAFDVMPTGTPGDYSDNGIAWIDVCDADVSSGSGNVGAARIGITSVAVQFGSRAFGTTAKPVQFIVNSDTRMQLNTNNTATFNIGQITQSQSVSGSYVGYTLLNTNNSVAESNPIFFLGNDFASNRFAYFRWNNGATSSGFRENNQLEIVSNIAGTGGVAIGALGGTSKIKFVGVGPTEMARFENFKFGILDTAPDSSLTVGLGAYFKRGVRMPNIPSGSSSDSVLVIGSDGSVKKRNASYFSSSGSTDTSTFIIDTTLNALAEVVNTDSIRLKSIEVQYNGTAITPDVTDSTLSFNIVTTDTTTVPLITFTAGAGFASDTAMVTDSSLFGSFFTGQYEYTIKEVQAVIKGNSGDSIVLKIVYNDSFNVDGTKINGAGLSVSNRVFGNNFTVSTNRTIPANNWVWLKPEAIITGKKPKYISLTVLGYKTYVTP